VLAAQDLGDDRGKTAQNNAFGVDQDPLLVDVRRGSGEGLHGCQAQVQCSSLTVITPEPMVMHQLTSVGSCEANEFISSRTVSIEVRQ
jgi:hypothetical protein